jgi:hypothetical protein
MGAVRRAAAWFEQASWPQVIVAGVLGGCAASALTAILQVLL